MTDLVDQMFPPIHRKWAPEFTDFNFWKVPVQEFTLPDLTPPSPALSARSDTSNQSTLSRIRNFSLVGTRQINHVKQYSLSVPSVSMDGVVRSSHLRQMSSLEKLSTTLVGLTQSSSFSSRRSVSPDSYSSSSLTYADSESEDEGGDEADLNGEKMYRRRSRRRSMTSMPGSLDDMHFGMHEDGGYADADTMPDGEDGAVENEEEAAEEAFDEDFLATGEMKDVPFL